MKLKLIQYCICTNGTFLYAFFCISPHYISLPKVPQWFFSFNFPSETKVEIPC